MILALIALTLIVLTGLVVAVLWQAEKIRQQRRYISSVDQGRRTAQDACTAWQEAYALQQQAYAVGHWLDVDAVEQYANGGDSR